MDEIWRDLTQNLKESLGWRQGKRDPGACRPSLQTQSRKDPVSQRVGNHQPQVTGGGRQLGNEVRERDLSVNVASCQVFQQINWTRSREEAAAGTSLGGGEKNKQHQRSRADKWAPTSGLWPRGNTPAPGEGCWGQTERAGLTGVGILSARQIPQGGAGAPWLHRSQRQTWV